MALYATFKDLERLGGQVNEAQLRKSAAVKAPEKNLFLSHSSSDSRWLPGLIVLLQSHGGRVYIDRDDERLPRTPSQETAAILLEALHSRP